MLTSVLGWVDGVMHGIDPYQRLPWEWLCDWYDRRLTGE